MVSFSESINSYNASSPINKLSAVLPPILQGKYSHVINRKFLSSLPIETPCDNSQNHNDELSGGLESNSHDDSDKPMKKFSRNLPSSKIKLAENYYRIYSFFNGSSGSMEIWENVLGILHSSNLQVGHEHSSKNLRPDLLLRLILAIKKKWSIPYNVK
jgi:hypothetical protein